MLRPETHILTHNIIYAPLGQLKPIMSKTPSTPIMPSFSPKAGSYKRRSLQSPFILNDFLESDDDHKQTKVTNKEGEEEEEETNESFIFTQPPIIPDVIITNLKQQSSQDPGFGSLNADTSPYKTNKMLPLSGRSHKRTTSTASITYTPPVMPVLPPNSLASSPQKPIQPFKFTSMSMNNNSSESLVNTEGSQAVPGQQVLPKANYRRGHRYKHSSVSMNMFQDPIRLASMTQPKLPEKYPIPTTTEVINMTSPSQKKKMLACLIQACFVLAAYFFGFKYTNSCLSTLAHILFYDVVSNISYMSVQLMSNFEVWKLSSLQYPFGLGRIEVLLGFALSVSLLFVGLDLISHIAEELLVSSFLGVDGAHFHQHDHNGSSSNSEHEVIMNPIGYELFVLGCIFVTIFTSHFINYAPEKEIPSRTKANVKRISSITLNEPLRETPWDRVKGKLGFRTNLLYSSTTGLSIIYGIYCLYYPFAQGLFQLHSIGRLLHQFGVVSEKISEERNEVDLHDHIDDAIAVTEWINHCSTIIMAILVTYVAWKLIWKLGNILLLASPSINSDRSLINIESLIESNVSHLDVYKNSYTIEEVKVAKLNTRIYVVIMKVKMPGASDDDESKFRFYAMRIIRGLMYQAVKGGLQSKEPVEQTLDDKELHEANRRSLIDLLNLSTSIEDIEGIDKSGDQFEITIDINRL